MNARECLFLVAAVAAAPLSSCRQADSPGAVAETAEEQGKGVDRSRSGRPLPETEIRDPDDEPAMLAELTGEPILVNLWASWCAPCVKELPTLQALSQKPGAPTVVLVSQDTGPRPSVDAFLDSHKIDGLESWHDPKMALSGALGVQVLPTTIYYDSAGREVWRYVGDLDWTGEEAARLLAEAAPGGG